MTIAAAWIRTLENGAEEMIFCADSRMTGGKRFDHCQKTFRFSRTDAAICFAGDTDWAYPMIVAAIAATGIHIPSQTRQLSLPKFKSHILNLLNQMQQEVHNFAEGEEVPDVTFLFGGYDWWKKRFRLWRIHFDHKDKAFCAEERKNSSGLGRLGIIETAGCEAHVDEFRTQLKALVQVRYGHDMYKPDGARFNMEPFEIIRDLLRKSDANSSIGGAPQGVKLYQYLSSVDIGVLWPNTAQGRLYLSGRPLLSYERADVKSIIDPDTLNSTWCSGTTNDAAEMVRGANANDAHRRGEAIELFDAKDEDEDD